MDFGLTKVMQQSLTKQKSVIEAGTPGFQAPEQLMSQIVDVKADVYAFGCVLIRAIWWNTNMERLNTIPDNIPSYGERQSSEF